MNLKGLSENSNSLYLNQIKIQRKAKISKYFHHKEQRTIIPFLFILNKVNSLVHSFLTFSKAKELKI